MSYKAWAELVQSCARERKLLVADLEAVRFLLSDNDSSLLVDSLPGSPEDMGAKKLRKGLYLTTFNRVESLVMNTAIEFANSISRTGVTFDDIGEKLTNMIRKKHMTGLRELNKDSFLEEAERTAAAIQFANGVSSSYRTGPVKFDARPYFTRPNIGYDVVRGVANDFKDIIEVMRRRFASHTVSRRDSALVDFGSYSDAVSKEWLEDFQLMSGVGVRYAAAMEMRHNCAHRADFAPDFPDLRKLCSTSIAFADVYISYLLSLVSLCVKRDLTGFCVRGDLRFTSVYFDSRLRVVEECPEFSLVINPNDDPDYSSVLQLITEASVID